MTQEKLDQANALSKRIEKAREIKAIFDNEFAIAVRSANDMEAELVDKDLRQCIAEAIGSHIGKLEYDFKWL